MVYRTDEGKVLHSLSLLLMEGTRNIRANNALVPEDHQLISDAAVRITVDANGVSSLEKVEFIYRIRSDAPELEVRYMDGEKVIITTRLALDPGTTAVYPAAALLPAGYVLLDTEEIMVTVDEKGNITPAVITFRVVAE